MASSPTEDGSSEPQAVSATRGSEDDPLSRLDLHQLTDDKPVFACQKCSEVIVRDALPLPHRWRGIESGGDWSHAPSDGQALQDELVSKAFNGRSGRA
jgi:hypothetical protein